MPVIATVPPIESYDSGVVGLPVVLATGTTVTTAQEAAIRSAAQRDKVSIVYADGTPNPPSRNSPATTGMVADAVAESKRTTNVALATKPTAERAFSRFTEMAAPPAITANISPDASYNRSYSRGSASTPPADWPVDNGDAAMTVVNGAEFQNFPSYWGIRRMRLMTDGTHLVFYFYAGTANTGARFYVDGQLVKEALTGYPNVGFYYTQLVFDSAKPRLIEVDTEMLVSTVFTKKPYSVWKPTPAAGPLVYVVGDSYAAPSVMHNDVAGSSPKLLKGIYQDIGRHLGTGRVLVNGVGGTGYLRAATGDSTIAGNYRQRLSALNAGTFKVNPDMVVIHGGGANDLFHNSGTIAQIAEQIAATFSELRVKFPDAKLVFVEGFAPPGFTPATYNANYVAIREQAQGLLAAAGVGVYFIDVATSSPWIVGTGFVTSPNASNDNSNVYIGNDGVHYTEAGGDYIRGRIAGTLRRVLNDAAGALVGKLV